MDNLGSILDNFKEKKILVIGDVMLDHTIYGTSDRLSPEAPSLVVKHGREEYNLGGAGNVAYNIKNLSDKSTVYLFGFIGDDNYGEKILSIAKEKNIIPYLEKEGMTTLKQRIIVEGRGSPHQVVRIDRESNNKKRFEDKKTLFNLSDKADIIVISDYAKGAVNSNLRDYIQDYKHKIIADLKPPNSEIMEIYRDVFMLKCNNSEAAQISKQLNYEYAGDFLRAHFNSNILITRGIKGMTLFPLDRTINKFEISANAQENFDPTGAGDTVIAVLALALSKDRSLESILSASSLGNIAAGITVKHTGAYAPIFQELRACLNNETENFGSA
ncbi:MAG: PfkB family carbohydrate kinase [Nanoarchaeota archaeon]